MYLGTAATVAGNLETATVATTTRPTFNGIGRATIAGLDLAPVGDHTPAAFAATATPSLDAPVTTVAGRAVRQNWYLVAGAQVFVAGAAEAEVTEPGAVEAEIFVAGAELAIALSPEDEWS